MVDFMQLIKNPLVIGIAIAIVVIIIVVSVVASKKSGFKTTLITPASQIEPIPPMKFTALGSKEQASEEIPLVEPVVPEEIGLAMIWPQGAGASMDKRDSNSFEPSKPGPLLTDYTIPESYGESSLTDPLGQHGAGYGARILTIKDTGNQLDFKPVDESMTSLFAHSYGNNGEVQTGSALINNAKPVNYDNNFNTSCSIRLN